MGDCRDQRSRVAHFLEKQGFKKQALAVSNDNDHKFDLALALGELSTAYELASVADQEEKWKQLANAATARSELPLAGVPSNCECFYVLSLIHI